MSVLVIVRLSVQFLYSGGFPASGLTEARRGREVISHGYPITEMKQVKSVKVFRH
jgi:hypothetical protein